MLARFVRYTFGSLLLVLLVAIVLVLTLDFGRFKGHAEVLVSNLLKREFTIEGPVHLTIGQSIEFSAGNTRLASAKWSTAESLVSFRHIEARVNSWSLIRGPIRLESLVLDGLRVNLEEIESGEKNWALIGSPDQGSIPTVPPSTEDSTNSLSLPILPLDINITDAILSYHNPEHEQTLLVVIDKAQQLISASDDTQFTLDGKINKIPISMNVTAGPVSHIIDYSDVEFNINAAVGDIRIEAIVAVADLLKPSRPTVSVSINGPKIEHLTETLGIQQITSGPLQVKLLVKPVDQFMQLDLTGTLGEFTVLANGKFADLQKLQNIELQVSASGPDIGQIAVLAGINTVPNDAFNLSGSLRRSGTVVSGENIVLSFNKTIVSLNGRFDDFPNPDSATVDLHIKGPDIGQFNQMLGLPGKLDGPFELKAKIVPDGSQNVAILLKANAGDITLNLDGSFTDAQNLIGSQAKIRLQAANFDRIADAFNIEHNRERSIALSAVVERVDAGVSINKGLLVFGKDQLNFSGVVGNEPLKLGTDIRFQSTIPDIQSTLSDFKIAVDQLPRGELTAAGQVLGGDEKITIKDLSLSLAGVKADLEADLSPESILGDSKITFSIKGEKLSDLVPSNDQFRVPERAFTLNGSVFLEANTATIPKLKFNIGKNQLSADIILGLEPALKSVRAKISASGPNLNELSPYFKDMSIVKAAPFNLHSEIVWEDGLLEINKFLGNVAKARLEISGRIQDPPDFNNTNLRLVMHIADMHHLSVLAGRELPHSPADLTIHLLGKDNTLTAQELDGHLGDSDVRGDLSYRASDIPEFNLKLVSKRLDLSPFLKVDKQSVPQKVTESKATAENVVDSNKAVETESTSAKNLNNKNNNKVIPDTPITIELLKGFTANIDMRIQDLILRQHAARDFVFSATIGNGELEVKKFEMETISGGELIGRLDIQPKHGGAQIWGTLAGRKLTYGLPFDTEEEFNALPRYDLDMAFLTEGINHRELAAALNGYLKLTSGEGKLKSGSMQMFTNDFLFELLNKINPFAKNNAEAKLKCTVILATVEQGKVIGDPALVIQSERLNVFAYTRIDLSTEELDVNFKTVPQKGLGLSMSNLINPYVEVGGNLGSPVLELNPKGVILDGGVAVATGGLSILLLGLKDRFLSDNKPCDAAVAETDEQFSILVERYRNPHSSQK